MLVSSLTLPVQIFQYERFWLVARKNLQITRSPDHHVLDDFNLTSNVQKQEGDQ